MFHSTDQLYLKKKKQKKFNQFYNFTHLNYEQSKSITQNESTAANGFSHRNIQIKYNKQIYSYCYHYRTKMSM